MESANCLIKQSIPTELNRNFKIRNTSQIEKIFSKFVFEEMNSKLKKESLSGIEWKAPSIASTKHSLRTLSINSRQSGASFAGKFNKITGALGRTLGKKVVFDPYGKKV